MKLLKVLLAAAIIAVGFGSAPAPAVTFRFADQGDALSMDPQALNESLQLSIMGNVYEPLVGRGKKLELVPILATSWKQTSPTVWRFVLRKGKENAATLKANGTGPFMLKSREPGVRTVFVPNPNYWTKVESNITEAVFTPIGNAATRVAALISGDIDMMEPVPLQDLEKVSANASLKLLQGPELRTIFLGMDQSRDELLYSSVKGKNPFKDKRVRQAFYQAIDENAIAKTVMRGAATPTALMVAPGINGFVKEQNARLPYDTATAKKLLADAG